MYIREIKTYTIEGLSIDDLKILQHGLWEYTDADFSSVDRKCELEKLIEDVIKK